MVRPNLGNQTTMCVNYVNWTFFPVWCKRGI